MSIHLHLVQFCITCCHESFHPFNYLLNSLSTYTDGQASLLLSVENSDNRLGPPHYLFPRILPIPSYHIGSESIKVDSHLSQSVLARSIWQYWQRGFCASFSLPFSVQRVLPPDVPFLQTGDGPVADGYSWNRLALYYQTLDGPMVCCFQLSSSDPVLFTFSLR